MMCGLSLSAGAEDLALQYLAVLQALAYSTLHILEEMTKAGYCIKLLYFCGGLSKNPLFVQTHADVTGLPVVLPEVTESVLLGAAILGARASNDYPSLQDAMSAMGGTGDVIMPDKQVQEYHKRKYRVFLKMVEHQKIYRGIMEN